MTEATTTRIPIDGPAAWRGDELTDSTDWIYSLSSDEIDELLVTAERFVADDPDLRTVCASDYTLGVCVGALRSWGADMDNGRGFVLVRGFPTTEGDEVSGAAFFIIGLHLGIPMSLNSRDDVVDHLYATSDLPYSDPNARASSIRDRLPFHSDSTDVVGLMCLQSAKRGGQSRLASGPTIYNEVLRRRPDLVELLFEPWYFDHAKQNDDGTPYYDSPICCYVDGVLSTYFGPGVIRSAQRYDDVPKHSRAQLELLDLIDEITAAPGIALDMDLQPGDIQLLLNYSALHSRSTFEDWPEPERRRHLLRFWLRRPTNRPLTPRFGKHFVKDRNAILASDRDGNYRISEAVIRPAIEDDSSTWPRG